jgi:hypothetical protein
MHIPREEWNLSVRQYVRVAFGFDSATAESYAESLNEAYRKGFSPTEAVDKDMDSELV